MHYWVLITLSLFASCSFAGNYVVITHSPMPEMEEAEVKKVIRELFLKQRDKLPNNERSMALMPQKTGGSYPAFVENVLEMSPEEFDGYWKKQKQDKAASPPREIQSDRLMLHLVDRTLGAIGVVPKKFFDKHNKGKVNKLLEF